MAGGLIVKTPATLLTQSMTAKKRAIVLTVDAFGTLFTRREPIAKQYGYVARKHGLSGFTDEEVETNFRIGNPEHLGLDLCENSELIWCISVQEGIE